MNRKIKFRIWEKEKLRYYPSYVDIDNPDADFNKYTYDLATTGEITRTNYLDDCEVWAQTETYNASSEVEIEIFTGLKDKNGKEIYEGDILGGIFEGCYIGWCDTTKSFELFNCYEHYCMACDGDILWCELSDSDIDLEVIGNIHKNPELLEGEE